MKTLPFSSIADIVDEYTSFDSGLTHLIIQCKSSEAATVYTTFQKGRVIEEGLDTNDIVAHFHE
jgi:hypothetical protein